MATWTHISNIMPYGKNCGIGCYEHYVCMYEENRQTFACSYYGVSLVHKLVCDIAYMLSHIFSIILLEFELKYKLLHINEKVL